MKKLLFIYLSVFQFLFTFGQQWEDVGGLGEFMVDTHYYKPYSSCENTFFLEGSLHILGGGKIYGQGSFLSYWNGHNWENDKTLPDYSRIGDPVAVVSPDKVYLCGSRKDHLTVKYRYDILAFDGGVYTPFSNLKSVYPKFLQYFNDTLYYYGSFLDASNDTITDMVKIGPDGNYIRMHTTGEFSDGDITYADETDMYAAVGYFTFGITNMARYDGTTWYSMDGNGLNMMVKRIIKHNNQITVGCVDYAGNTNMNPLRKVQQWNGSNWVAIGSPAMDEVWNLTTYKGKLYAAGIDMQNKGQVWEYQGGTTWTTLTNEKFNARVYMLVGYKDELYAGGEYDSIGTENINNIARFKLLNDVNVSPDAVTDRDTLQEETAKTLFVRNNDTDANGDYLLTTILQKPKNGKADVMPSDEIRYISKVDFSGRDTLKYKVCDQGGLCDSAFVYLVINPVNDAPTAKNDRDTTGKNTPLVIDVQANDSDTDNATITTTIITQGNKGTATVLNGDSIEYTPATDSTGADTLQYKVCDGATCDSAFVYVYIDGTNSVYQTTYLPFTIYPNPASQYINIQPETGETLQVYVYDFTGKLLSAYSIDRATRLDISGLPPGTYTIKAVNRRATSAQRFIKH